MSRSLRIRLVSLLASLALAAATCAFLWHVHPDGEHHERGAVHCDLCLQLDRALGPAATAPALAALFTAWLVSPSPPARAVVLRRRLGPQRARAPPSFAST